MTSPMALPDGRDSRHSRSWEQRSSLACVRPPHHRPALFATRRFTTWVIEMRSFDRFQFKEPAGFAFVCGSRRELGAAKVWGIESGQRAGSVGRRIDHSGMN
jgi:hypothetical protein